MPIVSCRPKGRSAPLACCLPHATGRRGCHRAEPHGMRRSGAPLTAPKSCGTRARRAQIRTAAYQAAPTAGCEGGYHRGRVTYSELQGKKEQCSCSYAEKHCSGWMYFSWRPGVKGRGLTPRSARRPAGSRGWPACRCGRWAVSGPAGFRGSSRAAGRGPGI